jgi:hypothetical protein
MASALTPRRIIRQGGNRAAAPVGVGERRVAFQGGTGAGLRALGNVFERISGTAGQMFEQEFKKEAKRIDAASESAGKRFGMDADLPDLARLPAGDTVAEQAFRRGALLSATMNAEMQARSDVAQLEQQFEADPQGFMNGLDAVAKGFTAKLPEDIGQMVRETYQRVGTAAVSRVQGQRRDLDIANGRAMLAQGLEGLTTQTAQAARAGDYETALFNLGRMAEVYIAAGPVAEGGAGLISPIERQKQLAASQAMIQEEYLLGYLDRAGVSDSTLIAVRNGRTGDPIADEIIGSMMPQAHDRVVARVEQEHEAAIRKAYTQEQRAHMWAERERKVMETAASKEGDVLLASNRLTTDWVEANRANLSEADHRYFYRQLTDEGTIETAPAIYADLRTRAAAGEDVREEARGLLVDRQMSKADYDKVVGRVEAEMTEVDLPNWYKRGERFIGQTLRVSDINPNPADAQMQAAAMDEWTQWAGQHPEATDEQARTAYQRIAQEYRFVDLTQTSLALPIPATLAMERHRRPARDEVMAAMRRVAEQVASGAMPEQEGERQAGILEKWLRIAEETEDSAP